MKLLNFLFRAPLFFVFILPLISHAQSDTRCGTTELLNQKIAANPDLVNVIAKQEENIAAWIKQHKDNPTRNVITIPVVVHLVYNPNENYVFTDHQVKDQIDILNEDYRRLNGDAYKTPADFLGVVADCEVQFVLAKRDPSGNSTTGIVREIYTDVNEWDMSSFDTYKATAWPREDYLNVWVAYLPGSVLGWATFPTTLDFTDGVVVADRAFSRIDPASGNYNRGRTLTHEVGHWLNLKHVSGDDGGTCSGSDYCEDTPNQADDNTGCPTHPFPSCSNNGDMFMNFMDYVRDSCMNAFTNDQKLRMQATLSGDRHSVTISLATESPVVPQYDIAVSDILYPYSNVDQRFIEPVIRIRNNGANAITSFNLQYGFYHQDVHSFDWTGNLLPGNDTVLTLAQVRDSSGYGFFMANARNVNGGVVETDTVNNFMSRSFYVSPEAYDPVGTMTVFGNPSSGVFNLQFDVLVGENFEIDAFNMLGQRVPFHATNPLLNRLEISLENAVPGTYFVRVINNRKKLSAKLLVLPPQ